MKLLRRCDNVLQAEHFANILRAGGIACTVRNTTLFGALGEIPFDECAPQLWVKHAFDETRAHLLLAELDEPVVGPDWQCTGCGEALGPRFAQCWQCGRERP